MADIATQKSKTDRCRIFKLGGWINHVTRHVLPLFKVKGRGWQCLPMEKFMGWTKTRHPCSAVSGLKVH